MSQQDDRVDSRAEAISPQQVNRRAFVKSAAALMVSAAAFSATTSEVLAQGSEGGPVNEYGPDAAPVQYPNTDVIVLDPERFTAKQGNAPIRRL